MPGRVVSTPREKKKQGSEIIPSPSCIGYSRVGSRSVSRERTGRRAPLGYRHIQMHVRGPLRKVQQDTGIRSTDYSEAVEQLG